MAVLIAMGSIGARHLTGATIPHFTLSWDLPHERDSNLLYTVYSSPSMFPADWSVVTNVHYPETSVPIVSSSSSSFFMVTVSNYWGELPISSLASPNAKEVVLAWEYAEEQDPGLVFKLYHSTDDKAQVNSWSLITNVPGSNRSLKLELLPGTHFFALTASNSVGESEFSYTAATPPLPTHLGRLKLQNLR